MLTDVGWYERSPGRLHPETALPHPSCPFVVKDLDGDGRLDIIFGRGHEQHVIDESWSQAHALALADLDKEAVGGRFHSLALDAQNGRAPVKKDMCISCGNCSTYCEMGIDVRQYAIANQDVKRAACVGCGMCAHVCPRGVLRLENKPVRWKAGQPIRVYAVDL